MTATSFKSNGRTGPLVVLFIALLLIVIGVAWWLGARYLYFGDDPPPRDYVLDYNDLARRTAGVDGDTQNMWPRYEAMVAAVIAADESFSGRPVVEAGGKMTWSIDVKDVLDQGLPPGDETKAVLDGIEHFRRAGVFDHVDALGDSPHAARQVDGSLLEMLTPDLDVARQLARIESVRLIAGSRSGDIGEVAAATRQSVTLARVFLAQPRYIERITGHAILGTLCNRLREQAVAHPPSPAAASELIAALSGIELAPLSATIEGERLTALDATVRNLPPGSRVRVGSRGAQMAKIDELYIPLRDAMDAPMTVRNAAVDEFNAAADALPATYVLVQILLPAPAKLIQGHDQVRVALNGTITVLAIEAYAAAHGAPPAELTDLVPTVLSELPPDIYSDGPFVYKRKPEDDGSGTRYLLYSVGTDGVDDGGRTDPENAFRAFSRKLGAGFDYVLNTPAQAGP